MELMNLFLWLRSGMMMMMMMMMIKKKTPSVTTNDVYIYIYIYVYRKFSYMFLLKFILLLSSGNTCIKIYEEELLHYKLFEFK
jgi:hypothetical protein